MVARVKIMKANVPIKNNIRENIKTMIAMFPWILALEIMYVTSTLLEGLIKAYVVGLLHIKISFKRILLYLANALS